MKKLQFIVLIILLTSLLSSCTLPQLEPCGEWVCEDPYIYFDFGEGYSPDNTTCTILLNGEEHTYTEVSGPIGERIIPLGTYEPYPDANSDSFMFNQEIRLEYTIEDGKLTMLITNSIYDEYPRKTVLEFTYLGEDDGFIVFP